MIAGVCRVCGCTEEFACLMWDGARLTEDDLLRMYNGRDLSVPDVCTWIEPDLCSACVTPAPPPLLFDANGNPLRGAP